MKTLITIALLLASFTTLTTRLMQKQNEQPAQEAYITMTEKKQESEIEEVIFVTETEFDTPTPSPTLTPTPTPTIVPTPKPTMKPTPKPIPTPVVAKVVWTPQQSEARIREVFGVNGDKAVTIARCESGLISDSRSRVDSNPSSYGLFQIRAINGRGTIEQLLDPEYNIQKAYSISGGGTVFSKAWVNCSKKHGIT